MHGVLIADPNAKMATLIAIMLRGFGHQTVTEVTDGQAFKLALARQSFRLIILDNALIKPNTLDIVRQMRAEPDHPNRVAAVIMTAAAPAARQIAEARDAGINEFLRKPFSATDLQTRIASLDLCPRDFVEAPTYSGPDRRRRQIDIVGAEKRAAAGQ